MNDTPERRQTEIHHGGPLIEGLRLQHLAVMDMLTLAVAHCPDAYWEREFGDASPFWKEIYHMLHYFVKYAHGVEGCEYTPFGESLDPSLSVRPACALSRETVLAYLRETRDYLEGLFRDITEEELMAADRYAPEQFGTVIQRILYGLRHGQHHVGKLTGYLFSEGIDYDPWR